LSHEFPDIMMFVLANLVVSIVTDVIWTCGHSPHLMHSKSSLVSGMIYVRLEGRVCT
jgi:hypothetical protein